MFNITRLVDALDERRSAIERFDDGRVLGIDHCALYADQLAGESIFKLPQKPAVYEYVTDEFRRRVEQARLSGFLWGRRVWAVDARSGAA